MKLDGYDAVIIGSGFAGAVTACRLSEAGFKRVYILERGRRYSSGDLPVLPSATFQVPWDEERGARKLPDFARAFWTLGQGLWDVRDLGELLVGQAAGFGGGSLIYANVHLRAPSEVFDDWPDEYRGQKLRDYYDLAAYMLDVEAAPLDLPKTVGLEKVAGRLGAKAFRPPLAVNFKREGTNRFGMKQDTCDMGGECCFGCKRHAKNTLDLNYLAAAERNGVEVRTLAEVTCIRRMDGGTTSSYEIDYRDHLKRGQIETIASKYVFLCAGAVNTTELLLRSRRAGYLPITGGGLGTKFYPNADELAVVFDCDEEHETDRGPTITTSMLYAGSEKDGNSWLMVQDGGLPAHLEPFLGLFRSPLWLHRNAFRAADLGLTDGTVSRRIVRKRQAAFTQKVGYAEMPVDALADILNSLTGSAIAPNLPLSTDVTRALLHLVQRGRDTEQFSTNGDARKWTLCPEQLQVAANSIRETTVDDIAIASEPLVQAFIGETARNMPDGLVASIRNVAAGFDIGNRSERELREWALEVGIQQIWGSEAGLFGAIAKLVSSQLAPVPKEVVEKLASVVRWALDYRVGDGSSTVLLSFGRDSKPATLDLASDVVPIGSRIRGEKGFGTLIHMAKGIFVLSNVEGVFVRGETLFAGARPVGVYQRDEKREFSIVGREGSKDEGGAIDSASLHLLTVTEIVAGEDKRRFRTDSYRGGKWVTAVRPCVSEARLRARLPPAHHTPERTTQELLLRDVAQELGGELRTNPFWPFLGRRLTVHPQGGCPMSENEADGVTKSSGEVWGCDGLYVMDGAAFPSAVGVNPSATIAAVAEWKIERFLRNEGKQPNYSAKEKADATRWADERRSWLDPIGPGTQAVHKPQHRPIGIEFKEVMKGSHRAWAGDDSGGEYLIETHLTAEIDDLALFLAADRTGSDRELRVSGKIRAVWPPDATAKDADVDPGTSRIWLRSATDDCDNETRSIEYRLDFKADGHAYRLDGIKDIRDDARFDIWEDTTTLCFLLRRVDEKEEAPHWDELDPCGWGVLRLPASEFFATQIPSLKATNVDEDPARQIWAVATFARFFFGHLVDVYVPALQRVTDVGKRVLGTGHV